MRIINGKKGVYIKDTNDVEYEVLKSLLVSFRLGKEEIFICPKEDWVWIKRYIESELKKRPQYKGVSNIFIGGDV